MKELTQEVKETKVIGYEANDGTYFKDKEECVKYERTAEGVIRAAFNNLIIKRVSEYDLFEGYGCGSEYWGIVLIHIRNAEELKTANMFSQFCEQRNVFDESHIGKEIVVGIGEGNSDRVCYKYGTIDELVSKFERDLKERLARTDDEPIAGT